MGVGTGWRGVVSNVQARLEYDSVEKKLTFLRERGGGEEGERRGRGGGEEGERRGGKKGRMR
jgi:hypothetical protein